MASPMKPKSGTILTRSAEMSLPTLRLSMKLTNPNWVPQYATSSEVPTSRIAINMDDYYGTYEVEVEVVQLNLNSGGMRVRFEWPNKRYKSGYEVRSVDVPIDAFFERYQIVEKGAPKDPKFNDNDSDEVRNLIRMGR
jgi:hypothetical protein